MDTVRRAAYEGLLMAAENRATMEPELQSMLGRHREELLRRALTLAISRSTLE
jgi:hypothetical protein